MCVSQQDWVATVIKNKLVKKYKQLENVEQVGKKSKQLVKKIAASISLNNIQIKKFKRLTTKLNASFKWEIQGPFDSSYSLAIVNRYLAYAAKRIGQDISIRSSEGFGDFSPFSPNWTS